MVDWRQEQLPESLAVDRRTPVFTLETTPPALRKNHLTTAWARVEVESGVVVFTEDEPPWECAAGAGDTVVIVPGRRHRVDPSGDARFAVQFFRSPQDQDQS